MQLLTVNRRRKGSHRKRGPKGRFVKTRSANRRHKKRTHRRSHKRSRAKTVTVRVANRRRHTHWGKVSRHRRRVNRRSAMGGLSFKPRSILAMAMPAVIGAGGAIALDAILAKVQSSLPAQLQSGWLNTLVKVVGAVGLGFGASKVLGKDKGKIVAAGALTIIGYQVLRDLIKTQFPTFASDIGLNAYIADGSSQLGYTDPASPLGAYIQRPVASSMGAYIQPGGGVDALNGWGDDDGM